MTITALAVLFVGLRILSRSLIVKAMGPEDWMLIVAAIVATGNIAIVTQGTSQIPPTTRIGIIRDSCSR